MANPTKALMEVCREEFGFIQSEIIECFGVSHNPNSMTIRELVSACVDDQIKRGIVKPEKREFQINVRVKGGCGVSRMTKREAVAWYEDVFPA